MDRVRLRRRLRILLTVGAILAALAYLAPIAMEAMQSWGHYRARAEQEEGAAEMEALLANHAGLQATDFLRERRMPEAEQWAKRRQWHLQIESEHRRKSRELLGRWW